MRGEEISACRAQKHAADSSAGGREKRGCTRRGNRGAPGLADSSDGIPARHDVNLYAGHFIHPEHVVRVEILLLYAAALYGYLALDRGGQAEGDGAFNLCLDRVGIYDRAAVDGANDLPDSEGAVGCGGHFGHRGDRGSETLYAGDPAARLRGERSAPAGFFGCKLQRSPKAG